MWSVARAEGESQRELKACCGASQRPSATPRITHYALRITHHSPSTINHRPPRGRHSAFHRSEDRRRDLPSKIIIGQNDTETNAYILLKLLAS